MTRPATTSTPTGASAARKWLIHGSPGSAKTPLALSYPCKKMLVVNADRKEVVLPLPADHYEFSAYEGAADPYTYLKSVLKYDWRADGIDCICIDTLSSVGADYLKAATSAPHFSGKVVTFGTESFKLSDKPHYGLAHNLMEKTLDLIIQCPVDVIAVVRHNRKLQQGNWKKAAIEQNFFLRGFNYCLIFKKEDAKPKNPKGRR